MHAHDDRDELAPPTPPARLRAIALAVLAHVLLIVALTWGVHWKTSTDQPAVQAELWAAVPQQAAPRAEPEPQPSRLKFALYYVFGVLSGAALMWVKLAK